MRLIRPAAAAFVLALAAGCAHVPIPGFEESPGLERKPLAGKREPTLLIAHDGSSCATTRNRWERARPGDRVWCVWSGGVHLRGGDVAR